MTIDKHAINYVCEFVQDKEFDSSLIILLDRRTNQMQNAYHFSGHPITWTSSDLASVAQKMAALTAEVLKTDVNVGRQIIYTGPKISIMERQKTSDTGWRYLCGLCVNLVRLGGKRLYVSAWFNPKYVGLTIAWGHGFGLYVGCFSFTFAYHT